MEGDREGRSPSPASSPGERRDQARVETAGQVGADRHVGAQAEPNAVAQQLLRAASGASGEPSLPGCGRHQRRSAQLAELPDDQPASGTWEIPANAVRGGARFPRA